jgi:hypothetical protein
LVFFLEKEFSEKEILFVENDFDGKIKEDYLKTDFLPKLIIKKN